jgi:hypothetical protein
LQPRTRAAHGDAKIMQRFRRRVWPETACRCVRLVADASEFTAK